MRASDDYLGHWARASPFVAPHIWDTGEMSTEISDAVTGRWGDKHWKSRPYVVRGHDELRWNKIWNVGNSYSYVATETKIRFHFRFVRSPDATFGGHNGWLLKKFKVCCRIITTCEWLTSLLSKVQLILEVWRYSNTIIFVMMTASIMSRCNFESSQISAQDTLFASWVMISCITF